MSRHTTRRKARLDELAEELTVGAALRLRRDSDEIHDVVRAVVEYLTQEYPAQDLYIPSVMADPTYTAEDMRAAVESGESIRSVCRRFRISRATLYRLMDEAA